MLLNELRLAEQDDFKRYLRMNEETFQEYITTQLTRDCKPIRASNIFRQLC